MIFKFIKNNSNNHSIKKMCQIFKVSRSGYFKNITRKPSKRENENTELLEKIKIIFNKHQKRYGSPRIWQELKNDYPKISKNRVARIMRENNIFAHRKKKFRVTTNSKHNYIVSPNIVNRNFKPDSKNKIWVSDITYIYTLEGWLFLCTIIDLFNKKVTGWSTSNSLEAKIAIQALAMAVGREKPSNGLIFHSDRGIQYACDDFRKEIKKYDMLQSMSRKGNCWDNAPAESFFNTLKVELIYNKKYNSRNEAIADIFEYIELYYNTKRIHSSLGYKTPIEFDLENVA